MAWLRFGHGLASFWAWLGLILGMAWLRFGHGLINIIGCTINQTCHVDMTF